ncbi:hypothetical protein GOP47_0020131 [Adiantum capillus-veneris]|uniref:Methyltransferase n=1 Tax=Adiantum capillus-veneris TaxID=13818 RepID=A0A9D4UCF0_ADICA|nr:hypothetical protein GOP47_0020131 [Adiantum capillus-veneris]
MALAAVKILRDELMQRPMFLRALVLLALSCACFYIGKKWATTYEELIVYSSSSSSPSSLQAEPHVALVTYHEGSPSQGRPPHVTISPTGILQNDGSIISKEFPMDEEVGNEDSSSFNISSPAVTHRDWGTHQVKKIAKFKACPLSMKEYIPCLDNVDAIKKLPSFQKGEKWERHCPEGDDAYMKCLVPPPAGYQYPIRWPKSRDEVWYGNVPHMRLVEDKGGQNWIAIKKNKFIFPGGGTQFAHGADQYLDEMERMVPDIAFGRRTRVALDIGCGVASWGAYLMSRNVIPLSIAPKDVHENQIQFALERGVPAMVAVLATRRLLYPSQAFDIIHCSRCRIEWTRDGGVLLAEVDRILRSGGYFAWAAQPVYKHEGNLPEEWQAMLNLTDRLCWTLVAKEHYIAIWQKPSDNTCYKDRPPGSEPPICDASDDPNDVWYVPMSGCIAPPLLDKDQGNISEWPARLHIPPKRLSIVRTDAKEAKPEAFIAEERYMKEIVRSYQRGLGLKLPDIRNVMDMNAGYGGFAAAVVDSEANWWVLNVVPINAPNTLPVIYDRGLIGVAHDWCESLDTYPRTYDLLHASGLFSLENRSCDATRIVLEMDRILRPGGSALIRDAIDVIQEIEAIASAVQWKTHILQTDSGPYGKDRLLSCKKILWRA